MKKSNKKSQTIKSRTSDFVTDAKNQLSPGRVKRAESKANSKILNLRLPELRSKKDIRQKISKRC